MAADSLTESAATNCSPPNCGASFIGHWHGRGAAALGLGGGVDPDQFVPRLASELPDGTILGTTRRGVREHVAGLDLTTSASKSIQIVDEVSIMASIKADQLFTRAREEDVP